MTSTSNSIAQPPVLRQIKDLPGPRGLPLLGNALQVDRLRVHEIMEGWGREYGPFFRVGFGPKNVLVTTDSATISAILRDRPDGFRRPAVAARVSAEMGGLPGLIAVEGTEWRNQRRLV